MIGAEELNYCVRDGNRCDLFAIVTGFLCVFSCFPEKPNNVYRVNTTHLKPLVKCSTY